MEKKTFIKEIFFTIVGTLFAGFGMASFLLPNKLSSGGFTGIATIFYYFLKFDVGKTVIILNIPFFIWAFMKLGKKFFAKCLVGTFFLSIFIDIFEKIPTITNDMLLASIYGGILIGIGTGIIFKVHASTGGTDLIVSLFKVYNSKIPTAKLLNGIDTVVVFLNVFFFGDIEIGLYSAIAIFIVGKMIDIVFEGVNFSKLVFIITDMDKPILRVLNKELNMGVTEIYGKGAYSEKEKKIIMTAINRREIQNLREKIYSLDKHAFLVVTDAREVYGLGFKSLD